MLISEVITELKEALEEHGNIEVRLYTDHDQTLMESTSSGVSYVQSLSYMPEEVAEEDLEYYPHAVKVYVLEAM